MSLRKEIILGEITGKNTAIHAYDKIIWIIRSGYLTLFYGGWAIVLNVVIDKGGGFAQYDEIMIIMFAVTFVLAFGSYRVDRNYLRRKFRVIHSLNELLKYSFEIKNVEDINDDVIEIMHDYIKVSGDVDNKQYEIDGYIQAVYAEKWLYGVSVLSLIVALLLVFC